MLIKMGKNSKVHTLSVTRNIVVTDDLSKIDHLIEIEENGQVVFLDADGNEIHTQESYSKKLMLLREKFYNDLQIEISKLSNEVTKAKMENEIVKLKSYPNTQDGQWEWKKAVLKIKDISTDIAAKIATELALKQMGF